MANFNIKKIKQKSDSETVEPAPGHEITSSESPFIVRTANEHIQYASGLKIPKMLFSEFIYETDLTILFASTGVGKTILGVQIADSIARGKGIDGFRLQAKAQKVIYFDLELSPQQFRGRYIEKTEDGNWIPLSEYEWDDNMYIVNFDKMEVPSGAEAAINFLIQHILAVVQSKEAKVIFIDNISWLATQGLETSKDAGLLLKKLDKLKKDYGLTIVVMAHTPKRPKWAAIGQQDLAGSAAIGNFSDSVFSINWSNYESSAGSRYLIQVKPSRYTESHYHANNVITVQLDKIQPNFTGVRAILFESDNDPYLLEETHVTNKKIAETKEYTEDSRAEAITQVITLKNKDPKLSSRDLSKLTGVSHTTCNKIINNQKQLFNSQGK